MSRVRELTVCFPAYNEASNVMACVAATTRVAAHLGLSKLELLFVDDGSNDPTPDVVARAAAADPRVRLVRHEHNLGYGAAVLTGITQARCEHFFLTDADLQFDLADLARMLPLAERFDFVQGYRVGRRDPPLRVLLGAVYRAATRALLDLPVRDPECSFRLARTSLLRGLTMSSRGPFVPVELVVRAARAGARFAEVGVRHHDRRSGRSHALSLRTLRMLGDDVRRFVEDDRARRTTR